MAELSPEIVILNSLSDEEPPYDELGRLVTSEIINTYLLPIVANADEIGYQSYVALSLASLSGLPEALEVIEAASAPRTPINTGILFHVSHSAAHWYGAAQEHGTTITPDILKVLRSAFQNIDCLGPEGIAQVRGEHPESIAAISQN